MTENKENIARSLIDSLGIKPPSTKNYSQFKLLFNPFPRAGISDLKSSSALITKLIPIDIEVDNSLKTYIKDTLFPSNPLSNDKYASAVIKGDYGSGKTQTLLYARTLLESLNEINEYGKKPYVVYIDNPGGKLTELVGTIISQIGEENFKRYLWNIVFERIASNRVIKTEILSFKPTSISLFDDDTDPFDPVNLKSYKSFFDAWETKVLNSSPKKKKEFFDKLKGHIISIFTEKFGNQTIALYFHDLLSENIGINKTWELLTSGAAKDLEKKEVYIIQAIVNLIEMQGYTDFYILVDEFEHVTAGRLTPTELDRYATNLRALIDKERNWCAIFAMTSPAYSKLKSFSPPLADRISSRVIELKNLNDTNARKVILNYLNLARDESQDIFPFDESGIVKLRTLSHGILRVFLKSCYSFIERGLDELNENELIDEVFVTKHFQIEEE